jgi:hypothetical protein
MVDMERAERLKAARSARDYPGPGEAAAAMGTNKFTYTQHEHGLRGFPIDEAIRYANFYRVRLEWLLKGTGPMIDGQKVPVAGYVGAGAEIYPEDPHPKGRGLKMVDAPVGAASDCVALMIRGDSMYPMGDGWLIFYRRKQEGVPDECINQLCVVKIIDGATLCKTLRRGTMAKRYTLESWNAPSRENVKLEWAAKVIDIRPP